MSVEREMSLAEWCAKLPSLHLVNQELSTLNTQLAALAEQNEKMRESLAQYSNGASAALSLPDLASPVLNKYRAEGMQMAADFVEPQRNDIPACGFEFAAAIRARADELEKTNAL